MPIAQTTNIQTYNAAFNPMKLAFDIDEYLSSAGTQQVVTVTDNTPLTSGATITFTIGEKAIEVNIVPGPSEELPEIRQYTNAPQLAEVVTKLQNIPIIGEYFTVAATYGTPSIFTFTQKTPSEADELTITGWTAATVTETTAAINPSYNANYKAIVKIYTQEDETASREFTHIATVGGMPDANMDVVLDIKKAFKGVLTPDAPADTTTAGPTLCTGMFKFFWYSFMDRFGVTAVEQNIIMRGYNSNYHGVIRGGMEWKNWDANTVNDEYFEATTNKFFTNKSSCNTSTAQPEWLYFFNKTQGAGLRLAITATFTDNTTDSFTAGSATSMARGVYRWAVGYTQLNMAANVTIPTGHRVKSYTVKVETTAGSVAVSETLTYTMEHGAAAETFVVFENKWSGFDTLRCIGETGYGIEAEGLDAVAVDDPDYAPHEGPIGQYNTSGRDVVNINTGFLTPTELEWLRELAESDAVYLVEGTALIKCTIDRGSFASLYGRTAPLGGLTLALKKANWR